MRKLLLILLLAAISLGIGVMSMGLISKLVLFSEVNGQVVDRGKPVAGAIITRYYNWSWTDLESRDQTVTDEYGRFHFRCVTRRSITATLFPHQPVIFQEIDIHLDKRVFQAWRFGKMNYDTNGELHGKPINVLCDIDTEPQWRGKIFGISDIL